MLARNLTFVEVPYYDDYSSSGVTILLDAMKSIGHLCTIIYDRDLGFDIPVAAVYGEQEVLKCPCQACRSCLSCKGILDPMLNT